MAWSKIVGFEVSPVIAELLDVALEPAAGQQVAGDVVEPEALAGLVQLLRRFHVPPALVRRAMRRYWRILSSREL